MMRRWQWEGWNSTEAKKGVKNFKSNQRLDWTFINRIDQAIFESEREIAKRAEAADAEIVFAELEKKHFG